MPPKQENQVLDFSVRVSLPNMEVKEDYKLRLRGFFTLSCSRWIYQLECTDVPGPEGKAAHPNWHFQGWGHVFKKARPKELAVKLRKAFPAGLSCHVSAASANGRAALKEYVIKRDESYREGPWFVEDTDANGHTALLRKYSGTVWRPWQQAVILSVSLIPDDRIINWVYDSVGCSGKSYLCRYLYLKFGYLKMSYTDTKRLLYLVHTMPKVTCYFFDLTRVKPANIGNNDLYAALENIKDGCFMNTFQTPAMCVMASPHVWVFSNILPKRESLSRDRWKIWGIKDQNLVEYIFQ